MIRSSREQRKVCFYQSSPVRLEGTDFEASMNKIKSEITKSELGIESNKAVCVGLKRTTWQQTQLKALEEKINSVPSEVIDPVYTARKSQKKHFGDKRKKNRRRNFV